MSISPIKKQICLNNWYYYSWKLGTRWRCWVSWKTLELGYYYRQSTETHSYALKVCSHPMLSLWNSPRLAQIKLWFSVYKLVAMLLFISYFENIFNQAQYSSHHVPCFEVPVKWRLVISETWTNICSLRSSMAY